MIDIFQRASRRYARFNRLSGEAGLVHAFSTRPQDVSAREDGQQGARAARRAQMAADMGLDAARLKYCVQVHETRLARVDAASGIGSLDAYDGALTDQPGVPLMTFSADCPLVIAYEPRRRALGLAHASWRCTVSQIAARLIDAMRSAYQCDPADILAGIGPSAGPCCYEVKGDVYEAAAGLPNRDSHFQRRDGRMYFDLWSANEAQLIDSGVRAVCIDRADVCTMCTADLFYSFRREGAGCGHFGLMAALL